MNYIDRASGEPTSTSISDYTLVSANDTTWGQPGAETYYVVQGKVELKQRVKTQGNVHLILTSGSKLYTKYGITVNAGDTLQIHGQSQDANSDGVLEAEMHDKSLGSLNLNAPIGASSDSKGGHIFIHGGQVFALSIDRAAAIGGSGGNQPDAEGVTIYDGRVMALANNGGAAIGGGRCGAAPVDIQSGLVVARANATVKATDVLGTGSSSGCSSPSARIQPTVNLANSLVFTKNDSTSASGKPILGAWLPQMPESFTVQKDIVANGEFFGWGIQLEMGNTTLNITKSGTLNIPQATFNVWGNSQLNIEKGGRLLVGASNVWSPATMTVNGLYRTMAGSLTVQEGAKVTPLKPESAPELDKALPETGQIVLKKYISDEQGYRAGDSGAWGQYWMRPEYSIDDGSPQTDFTFNGVKPGKHNMYVTYYSTNGDRPAYTKSEPLEVELAPAKPQAAPNYQDDKLVINNYNAQKVTTYQVCENAECSDPKTVEVNPDGTIANMSEEFGLSGDESKTVYLRSITDDGVPSAVQEITFAARPAAPTELSTQNTTNYGGQDGHIVGQTSGKSYEYYNPATSSWEPLTATTNLSAGDYQVRYAGSSTALPSEATTLTVKDPAPTGSVNFPLEKITLNPTAAPAGMQYVACLNAECTETKAVTPDSNGNIALSEFGNVPGAVNTTIRFALADANDPKKLLSEIGEAVVPPRPAAPTGLFGNAPSTITGSDGSISGMLNTKSYEYYDDKAEQWKPLTSDVQLPSGNYLVRFAANTTAPASQPAAVQIPFGEPTLTPVTANETLTVAPAEAPNGTHYVICEDASCSKSKAATVDPQSSSIKLSEFGALPALPIQPSMSHLLTRTAKSLAPLVTLSSRHAPRHPR